MLLDLHQFGRHLGEEAIAKVAHEIVDDRPRITAVVHRLRHSGEQTTGIMIDQSLDELVDWS